MAEDHHAILGVPANASRDEILRAYAELVKKVHPDHNRDDPDAREKFLRIQRAFETLYAPERRKIVAAFHTPLSAFLGVQCLPNSVRRYMDSPGFVWSAIFVCLCLISFVGLMLFLRWLLGGDLS
jgi:curved DNA-binding protein CbpA